MNASLPSSPVLLGCIADDFTGATDLANNLVRSGMRVMLSIGVPAEVVSGVDAVVVALKSRTCPADEAVQVSLEACRWLVSAGARQIYFKVCSTFDSTAEGNIGPVAQALAAELQAPIVPVTPAFPENGRTIYQGHLFVGELLLSDSPMRKHPLTPMTDANLVRVLQAQLEGQVVGLVNHGTVSRGVSSIQARLDALRVQGISMAVVDGVANVDLMRLAEACRDLPLMVAGSGLALGIPPLYGLKPSAEAARLPAGQGYAAVVSGSCSSTTQAQVAQFIEEGGEALAIDAVQAMEDQSLVDRALAWASTRLGEDPVLIYSTASPHAVKNVQTLLGVAESGAQVEAVLARIAVGLAELGVRRLVVAGGETSGACVGALGIAQLRVGAQIDPGVPWCYASHPGVHLALKSGNFGGQRFFRTAFEALP